MFESLDTPTNRYPVLRQAIIVGFAGILLGLGGCAGFLVFSRVRFLAFALSACFIIGIIALATSLILFIIAGIQGVVRAFRD